MENVADSKITKCADSHKVFFLNDYVARNGLQLLNFRNPGTGTCSKYIYHKKSNEFFELLKFNEPFRTWFVGDIITDDGGIYLSPPIDPLFLLLHFIQNQASEKFVPLEHILVDETYRDMTSIVDAINIDQLLLIADQKGDPQLKALRYNKEKTLNWLAYKCKQLQDVLRHRKLNLDSGATSSTFIVSTKLNDQQDEKPKMHENYESSESLSVNEKPNNKKFLKFASSIRAVYFGEAPRNTYTTVDSAKMSCGKCIAYSDDIQLLAFGILSDYLSKEMSDSLAEHLNLDAIKSRKRKQNSNAAMNQNSKKIKLSVDEEDITTTPTLAPVVEKKTSAKAKQLAKSAKGSKNIMSFFKAK